MSNRSPLDPKRGRMHDPTMNWFWTTALAIAGGRQPIFTVVAELAAYDPRYRSAFKA